VLGKHEQGGDFVPQPSAEIVPDHIYDPVAAAASHAALSGVLAGFSLLVLTNLLKPSTRDQDRVPRHRRLEGLLVVSVLALVVSAIEWGAIAGMPRRAEIWQQWTDFFIAGNTLGAAQAAERADLLRISAAAHEAVFEIDVAVAVMATSAVISLAAGALAFLASMGDFVAWQVKPKNRRTDSYVKAIRYGFMFLVAFAVFQVTVFVTESWALVLSLPPRDGVAWPVDRIAFLAAALAATVSFFAHPHSASGSRDIVARFRAALGTTGRNSDLRAGVASIVVGAVAFALPPAWPGQEVEARRLWAAAVVLIPAAIMFLYYAVTLSWRIGIDAPEPGAGPEDTEPHPASSGNAEKAAGDSPAEPPVRRLADQTGPRELSDPG
jgi:hypothetical protein